MPGDDLVLEAFQMFQYMRTSWSRRTNISLIYESIRRISYLRAWYLFTTGVLFWMVNVRITDCPTWINGEFHFLQLLCHCSCKPPTPEAHVTWWESTISSLFWKSELAFPNLLCFKHPSLLFGPRGSWIPKEEKYSAYSIHVLCYLDPKPCLCMYEKREQKGDLEC